MKVLLVGGGGREHALAWKIAQSPQLSKLYVAPGGAGLNRLGETIDVSPDNVSGIVDISKEIGVDLVVVGPEAPLAAGLADALDDAFEDGGIACFGPRQGAAKLETSKSFMKEVCAACSAPTASFGRFSDRAEAIAFLRQRAAPYVVKADGLAAGKGVTIAETLAEAEDAVERMLGGQFGAASSEIVIEQFLPGEEASFFALCDGTRALPLAAAQDHKRAFDGDQGPNTGGMGAYSPAPVFTPEVEQKVMTRIINPVLKEMARRGTPYRGVLYAGLMIDQGEPNLIEFNVRFGDPECQILMRRMESDLLPLLAHAANGDLSGASIKWSPQAAAIVVMAAEGYPGPVNKGDRIGGLDAAKTVDGVEIFYAGVKEKAGVTNANGGRVLNITATADTLNEALSRAYASIEKIDWPGGFYRRDIGWRALKSTPTREQTGASA